MSERQRRYRQRQRRHLAVYRIEANDRLLEALVAMGRLTDAETADRGRVEQELAALVDGWAAAAAGK